jgi:CelD/BcsL family acetyltransferase involved in cellulose biosynthesis
MICRGGIVVGGWGDMASERAPIVTGRPHPIALLAVPKPSIRWSRLLVSIIALGLALAFLPGRAKLASSEMYSLSPARRRRHPALEPTSQESDCHFVDLDAVRKSGGDYLALLSSNTRQQVRRSVKAYEKSGKLRTSLASSGEAAVEYLHGLQELHDAHWQGKGKKGAFPSEFTRRFHDRLVRDAVARGEVQMLRVTAGDQVVGYLYNFVRDGHVYFYQSGFKYTESSKFRPGLVCHYLAIMHNLEADNRIYDFLAGPQRYKQSLAAADVKMYWFALQKPRLVFAVERILRRVKRLSRRGGGRPAI